MKYDQAKIRAESPLYATRAGQNKKLLAIKLHVREQHKYKTNVL